jgi:hypothetical protein
MTFCTTIARLCAALALLAATAASAHEFWMLPGNFQPQTGEPASLSLWVGEYFTGGRVALSRPLFLQLRRHAAGGVVDMLAQVPASEPVGEIGIPLLPSGTQVLAVDTQPSHIVLPAGRFHAYLHDEGLDFIIKAREAAGTADSPGRERFRRHIKTIVRAGGAPDAQALQRTGQRIEVLPLTDPGASAAGRDLVFQVLFEGKPLAGALVKFWHRKGSQTLIIRTQANRQGQVSVTPPWPGLWMASVVHMIAATDSGEDDWDSFWGNLTFELPAR